MYAGVTPPAAVTSVYRRAAPGVQRSGVFCACRAVPRRRNRGGSHGGKCVPGDRGDRCQEESWEAAARSAVQTAANTVRDLRVAEVVRQDVVIENGQVSGFRVRLAISFKYESGD